MNTYPGIKASIEVRSCCSRAFKMRRMRGKGVEHLVGAQAAAAEALSTEHEDGGVDEVKLHRRQL